MKLKMINYLQKAVGLCAGAAILLLTACSAVTGSHIKNAGETASIRIAVDDIERTALPDIKKDDFSSFKLTWTDSDGKSYVKQWISDDVSKQTAYQIMNNDIFTLPVGTYTFVLTGTESYGAIYKGTLEEQIVTADSTLTFKLELAAISKSSNLWNTVKISLNVPNQNVKKVVLTYYKSIDENNYKTVAGQTASGYYSGGKYTANPSLVTGAYIFEFLFYGGESSTNADVLLGKWLEYVYVTEGRYSKADITIDSLDDIYSITYKNADDADFDTKPIYFTPHNNITLPEPEKEGYYFDGWYTSTDDGQTLSDSPISGWNAGEQTENITLYANWIKDTYTVTFCTNLYSDDESDEIYKTLDDIEYGETITAPTAPTKTGYSFVRWSEDNENGTAFDFENTEITGETILYAVWSYDVTFNSNGGTGTMPAQTIYNSYIWRDLENLPANTFERDGYSFLGWADSADKTQIDYADGCELNYLIDWIDNPTTLYAVWHDDSTGYVINFDTRCYHAINPQVVEAGETADEPEEPTYPDFRLIGWFTSGDNGVTLSNTPYDFENTEVTSNLTLYAKWLRNIYYVSENGSDTDGDGSRENPYATVTAALNAIKTNGNANFGFQIEVSGEIKENIVIGTDFTTDMAESLLLCGLTDCDTDIINGNKKDTVLTIRTPVQVTLQNITITNGYVPSQTYTGAGITIYNSDAKVYLGTDAVITKNKHGVDSSFVAGGIFVRRGTLYIEEDSKITGNEAGSVGGVGLDEYGYAYMNGGEISNNTSLYTTTNNIGGGGVYINNYGTFIMNGGSINNNTARRNGGGIYICSNADFIITAGEICNNNAGYYGGGIYNKAGYATGTTCKTIIEGGIISGNTANFDGGAIYNYEKSSISMSGGKICNNTATGNGGAVYNSPQGKFYMSGSAYIPAGDGGKNDVYLSYSQSYDSYISVDGVLEALDENSDWAVPVATITPQDYGKNVLCVENNMVIQDVLEFFALTPFNGVGVPIIINTNSSSYKYARPNMPSYSITYKDKGNKNFSGTFSSTPASTYLLGSSKDLPVPSKEGYIFEGWYTTDNCTGTPVTSFTELNGDTCLYASWYIPAMSITIESGDISISQSETETTITLTAADGFTDYTWFIEGNAATEMISGSSISSDGKSFTFSKASLLAEYVYFIRVVAKNKNGLPCSASVRIQK